MYSESSQITLNHCLLLYTQSKKREQHQSIRVQKMVTNGRDKELLLLSCWSADEHSRRIFEIKLRKVWFEKLNACLCSEFRD